jgi:tetratricopeptide (TPR) repeat protein
MKNVFFIVALLVFGSWVFADLENVHKLWEKANKLYQLGLYEEAARDFKICLDAYEKEKEKEMAAITQACLSFCYIRMGDTLKAQSYLDRINYRFKDGEWNAMIAGLHKELGRMDLYKKYMKKAKKYSEKKEEPVAEL